MPLVYKKIKEKIEKKDSIISRFKKLGMDAKLVYFCEKCNYLNEKPCFKIFVKAKNEKKWHESKIRVFGNETDFVSFSEFCMALNFLESKSLDENLPEIFNNLYNVKFREEYLCYFKGEKKLDFSKIENLTEEKALKEVKKDINRILEKKGEQKEYNEFFEKDFVVPFGFSNFVNKYYKTAKLLRYGNIYTSKSLDDNGLIKTNVDIALQKVLGVKIYYTKKEIAQNLKIIFKNEKMEMSLPLALEILKLKARLDSDFMLVNYKVRYGYEYKKYLEDKLKISFGKFCKNICKFYKKGEVSKTDYKAVLKFLHCLLKENIKNKKIKQSDFENYFISNQEKIEKYFIDNNTTFEEYVNACIFFDAMDIRNIYKKFIKKQAVKNNLKNHKQFCLDHISSNDYELSLNEYLKFVKGLKMIFDKEIDDLGDDEQ